MLTLSCSKNPREGSKKSWDGKPRGSGQSHRILLVPRGGWVPLTLGQPLKRLCPHLPHFCSKVPAQKRYFQTKGPQPPPWAPFTTALALGTNQSSPHFPHHCARCDCGGWVGAGPSWQWSLGGPLSAESAFPVPARLASSLSTSSSPLFQRQQMGQHSPQPPAWSPSSVQIPSVVFSELPKLGS